MPRTPFESIHQLPTLIAEHFTAELVRVRDEVAAGREAKFVLGDGLPIATFHPNPGVAGLLTIFVNAMGSDTKAKE
jgi:hypothetical protein